MTEPPRTISSFTTLGEFECLDQHGRAVALAPQRRQILATLVARAGQPLSRETLSAAVWGSVDDATLNRLKAQVSAIRRQLGEGVEIRYADGGYALVADQRSIDHLHWCGLLDRSRSAETAERQRLLHEADTLWRGPYPMAGIDNEVAGELGAALLRRREDALLDLAAASAAVLATGRTPVGLHHVLTRLGDWFAAQPSRADVAVGLATVHARRGDPAEASRCLDRHRRSLNALGLTVGPAVRRLELAVLRNEVGPVGPEHTEPRRADGEMVIARAGLRAQVDAGLQHGRVVVLGAAGSGKSKLLELVGHDVQHQGRPVIAIRATEAPPKPMSPVVDLFTRLAAVGSAAPHAGDDARLLDRLRAPGGTVGVPIPRDQLIHDAARLAASWMAELRAVLVVDDAHLLDANSRAIIERVGDAGVPIVVAVRPAAGLHDDHWAGWARVVVEPFDLDEVASFVSQATGRHPTEREAEVVHRRTGGNPLLVALLAEELTDYGTDGADPHVLPLTIRAVVGRRVAALGRRTAEALQRAAVGGMDIELAAFTRLVTDADAVLGDAAAEGLVTLEADRARFVHGVVVEALLADIPGAQRAMWADEWASALEDVGAYAVRVAPFALEAAAIDPHRAVRVALGAALELAAVADWGQSAAWAERGLTAASAWGLDRTPEARRLGAALGAARRRDMLAGSDVVLLDVARSALDAHDDLLFVDVVTELSRHGGITQFGTVDPRIITLLDRALQVPTDPARHAALCSAACDMLSVSPHWPRARALYRAAWDWAISVDPQPAADGVLLGAFIGLSHPDDLGLRRQTAQRLVERDDPDLRSAGWEMMAGVALVGVDRSTFDRAIASLRAGLGAVRQPLVRAGAIEALALDASVRGRFDECRALADEVGAARRAMYPESWQVANRLGLLCPVDDAEGRLGELVGLVTAIRDRQPGVALWHALVAWVASATGHPEAARASAAALVEGGLALWEDYTYTAALVAASRSLVVVDDPVLAGMLLQRLEPYAGQLSWTGLNTLGPIDRALAACHACLGDQRAAQQAADRATEVEVDFRLGH